MSAGCEPDMMAAFAIGLTPSGPSPKQLGVTSVPARRNPSETSRRRSDDRTVDFVRLMRFEVEVADCGASGEGGATPGARGWVHRRTQPPGWSVPVRPNGAGLHVFRRPRPRGGDGHEGGDQRGDLFGSGIAAHHPQVGLRAAGRRACRIFSHATCRHRCRTRGAPAPRTRRAATRELPGRGAATGRVPSLPRPAAPCR